MARSEIDDIFAAKKSTAKVVSQPVPPASTSTEATGSKKKKKAKKRKRQAEKAEDPDVNEDKPQKKRVVETVHDPSTVVSSASSSKKAINPGKGGASTTRPKAVKKEKEDIDRFKDSRGTGPRRKTEEGFAIFKEAELGINPEAGGTPLCPFDCDCCF